jgi:hypothetical protein
MSVQEIINRPSNSEYSVDELSFVVEEYIRDRKGVSVKIDFRNRAMIGIDYAAQVQMLLYSFEEAAHYFVTKYRSQS